MRKRPWGLHVRKNQNIIGKSIELNDKLLDTKSIYRHLTEELFWFRDQNLDSDL